MSLETPVRGDAKNSLVDTLKTLAVLFKARIVFLLVMASLGGAFLGAGGLPSLGDMLLLIVSGALAAGGSSAINQIIERDTDTRMGRTEDRPVASGRIAQIPMVWLLSIAMIVVPVMLIVPFNAPMAFYLFAGAAIYIGVYTIWLKPRSVLNIVIGGAAGSAAVMTGGAAVGAASDPGVIILALLVFLWTPAHFWALALYYKDDYAAAQTPMLPVIASEGQTAWWIFIHAAGTAFATLVLAAHPALGLFYLIPVALVTLFMLGWGMRLIRTPSRQHAIRLFVATNVFLLMVFVLIILTTTGRQLFL
ncbi:MAG: protoheme IX farnesyltransferase [Chloroflexi bacterium]|nr:protoheme IX farnesyltransferase [Chloroflexota bacterium]